jgi:hypothetical protein
MSFHTETHTIVTSGSTGTVTTDHKLRGFLWQVLISNTGTGNQLVEWDMEIREEDSNVEVLGWDNEDGDVNSAFGLEVPLQAMKYTLTILDVNDGIVAGRNPVDDTFSFRITVREPVYGSTS